MFCRNCGKEMDNNAAVCTNCGYAKGTGQNFCQNCGAQVNPGATFCTNCGAAISVPIPAGEQKSKLCAGLLGIFLGAWGIHNFYLGNNTRGIIQIILTVCSCGIASLWGFIEGILILCGNISTDANGVPLKD